MKRCVRVCVHVNWCVRRSVGCVSEWGSVWKKKRVREKERVTGRGRRRCKGCDSSLVQPSDLVIHALSKCAVQRGDLGGDKGWFCVGGRAGLCSQGTGTGRGGEGKKRNYPWSSTSLPGSAGFSREMRYITLSLCPPVAPFSSSTCLWCTIDAHH